MRKCTKRSSETLRLLTTLQTPECGRLSGPSSGSGRSNASCRWSSPVLLSKLGKNLTRPLDLRHSPRLQGRSLIQPSPKQRAACTQPGGRQSRSPQHGIREASGQGSHRTNVTGTSHLCQPDVRRTQIRRVMETSHKSPTPEQTCTNRTLQDGVNSASEGSHTERGLDGETRPEGCLPSCSPSPCSPKPLQLQLEGQTMEVQNSTIWSQQCSSNLHQAHEASRGFDEEASHPGHSIPGRYAHHGPEGGGDQGVPSNSFGNSDCSRFCNQPSQECDYSHTRDGVLRFPTGFKGNGHLTSTEENEILEAGSLTAEKSETGFGASLGQTVRHDGSCPPCSLASPPILQTSGEGTVIGTPEGPYIRINHRSEPRDGTRSGLVDPPSTAPQWQTPSDSTLGSDHRNGRIQSGMGSLLQPNQNRWSLDTGGKTEAHQFPRTTGSIPSHQELCFRPTADKHPSEDRQHHCYCFPEPDGGFPFPSSVRTSHSNLAMVPGTRDNSACRTSPRLRECQSRLGIQACPGPQRLDAPQGSVSTAAQSTGSFHHRFICLKDQCTASSVLQLAPRSGSLHSGYSVPVMERTSSLYFSSLCPNYPVYSEDTGGGIQRSTDSTSLAQSVVVPVNSGMSQRLPNPSTPHPEDSDGPSWRGSPNGTRGPSSFSRLAHLRRSFVAEGLSEGVINLISSSWRSSTEASYSSAWRTWDSWCIRRGVNPLSAPLSDILEFLLVQFQAGKQYRTINTFRSAISMTHNEIDSKKVGQHPLVTRFLRGVFNSRPPAPRYTCTWNVDIVLSFLENAPSNDQL